MLGAIAQFETEIRAKRQMDGIQQAKARGVPFGRHKTLTPRHISELCARRKDGVPISWVVHDYRISKATVYRYLGQTEQQPVTTDATQGIRCSMKGQKRHMQHSRRAGNDSMDQREYIRRSNWHGSFYELAMEFHPTGNDARLLAALQALWSDSAVHGPLESPHTWPEEETTLLSMPPASVPVLEIVP
jgi:Helix-turn-helix domain of resolvase